MMDPPEPLTLRIFITEKEEMYLYMFFSNIQSTIYGNATSVNYKYTNKNLMLQREVRIECGRHWERE